MAVRFNELKSGDTVNTFDAQTCDYCTRKVLSVSTPRFDTMARDMVVDVSIDGYSTPFVCAGQSEVVTANNGLLTISPNRERVIAAIENAENGLGGIINNIEKIKENYEKCKRYRLDLNPALKQQQENADEISKLKSDVSDMKKMLTELKELLK